MLCVEIAPNFGGAARPCHPCKRLEARDSCTRLEALDNGESLVPAAFMHAAWNVLALWPQGTSGLGR